MRLRPISFLLLLSVGLGCAGRAPFRDAPSQPAAVAEARVALDANGNAQVELWVSHLAPPAKLTPPAQTYVLWAESTFGRTLLLGRLVADEDLDAHWEGSVPFERFRLVISAEDLATPEQPRSPYVMTTDFLEPRKRSWL